MKVLSIGTDRKLFEEGSKVLDRNRSYAKNMEELHVIVFSLKRHGFSPIRDGNLFVYPTNSKTRLSYIFDAYKIGEKIIKNKIEEKKWVLTAQDPFETGLSAYLIKRKTGSPLQLQIHTDFLDKYFKNSTLNIIRVFIANFLIKRTDGIRVVSSVIKDSIKRKFKKLKLEPKVLPIFVDIENIINTSVKRDIDKEFPQFRFIILMASRLTKEKRIDIAIKSMRKVLEKFPHTGLVICGSGPKKRKLVTLVKYLKLEKNIVFVGWQEDLISYYKTANLFLLTSEYEGYGMTLVEAGASGCPIVTTRVGIAKTEFFQNGENCEICEKFDSECVSEAILSIVSDNQKRELLRRKMQDSIRSMISSKEEYIKQYIGILESLIK